jgi:hypothetical protein
LRDFHDVHDVAILTAGTKCPNQLDLFWFRELVQNAQTNQLDLFWFRELVLKDRAGNFDFRNTWKQTWIDMHCAGEAAAPTIDPIPVEGVYSDYLFQPWFCASMGVWAGWVVVSSRGSAPRWVCGLGGLLFPAVVLIGIIWLRWTIDPNPNPCACRRGSVVVARGQH